MRCAHGIATCKSSRKGSAARRWPVAVVTPKLAGWNGLMSRSTARASKPMTELIGMCRIAETVPDVELPVVIPSLAAMDLNVALTVESQYGLGPCPKASWRQSQLHNVRIVPLIHSCGDLVFAPRHWSHQNGHSMRGYARQTLGKLALPCGSLPSSRASPTSWPRSRRSPARVYESSML